MGERHPEPEGPRLCPSQVPGSGPRPQTRGPRRRPRCCQRPVPRAKVTPSIQRGHPSHLPHPQTSPVTGRSPPAAGKVALFRTRLESRVCSRSEMHPLGSSGVVPCRWSLGEGGSLHPRADRYWMGFPAAALGGHAGHGAEPCPRVYTGTVSSGDPGTGVNAPASLTVVWTLVYSAPGALGESGLWFQG